MLKKLLFILFAAISVQGFAQKVDIDKMSIKVSTAQLPDNFIAPEMRTYFLKMEGNPDYTGDDVLNKLKVYGWNFSTEDPTLDVKVQMNDFVTGKSQLTNRKEEKKDKAGKVISTTTYYKVSSTNVGRGSMYIYGEKNPYSAILQAEAIAQREKEKMEKAASKGKKTKADLKKEAAEEEIESNPFLQNVDLAVEEVETDATVGTSVNYSKDVAYTLSLAKEYVYSTGESTSSTAAYKEYSAGWESALNNHSNAYRSDVGRIINANLNNLYGYRPATENVRFKALDSKDHPEFTKFGQATGAMKAILGKMRYNQPVDQIAKELAPIMDYFSKTASNYAASDDKHEKRLRAACYYNLAQLHYYLDQHDKAIEVGNTIIASDYDKKDGERFVEKAEAMKKKLAFFQMDSRHVLPLQDDSADDVGEEVESTEADN